MMRIPFRLVGLAAITVVCVSADEKQQVSHEISWTIPSNGQPYEPITSTGSGDVKVGDQVIFTWPDFEQHNVVIHPSGTCDPANGTYLGSTSPLQYTFGGGPGTYTFACDVGAGTHCQSGQIINITVTSVASDSESKNDANSATSEEQVEEDKMNYIEVDQNGSISGDHQYNEEEILNHYQEFFNLGETQHVLEFKIKPYKVPLEVTTYVDFLFNLPPEMFENDPDQIVHIVAGDVIVSQPKHLHHFILTGCTESVPSSEEGLPASSYEHMRSCNIPVSGWGVGGDLFGDIPVDAGQVFGPGLGIKALHLNVHYTDGLDVDFDNPNTVNDGTHAIATDGIRIVYTLDLRPKSVITHPLINVGLPLSPALTIPPNQERFFYTKTCTIESSCRDADDKQMKQLGSRMGIPGMEDITCESVKMFCFMATGFERFLHTLCPVSCGLCDSTNENVYHLNSINYHAHLSGREMYATLLSPKNGDDDVNSGIETAIDLESKELWLYDDQVNYPLRNVTLRPGDQIQATCVYNTMQRKNNTVFGLSTYDEMCITQVSMIIDTPNMTIGQENESVSPSLMASINLNSFMCAVDKENGSSDIWRGSLEPDEDARQIYKDHPIESSDCRFPVGSLFGGGVAATGDGVPTGEAFCATSDEVKRKIDIICFDAGYDAIFDGEAVGGIHCEGGTFHDKDSNDPSVIAALGDSEKSTIFEDMCTSGGGWNEPYTCKDAKDQLDSWQMMFVDSETKEYMRKFWWQPKCCVDPNVESASASYGTNKENISKPSVIEGREEMGPNSGVPSGSQFSSTSADGFLYMISALILPFFI